MDNVPKVETIRGLLENSGNQCAFPGCSHPVLNHRNQFIAKLALLDDSIEPGVDHNRSENLMFVCYRHYVETRDSITYPIEILRSIKENHETSSLVEKSSRFQFNTIAAIQESMTEQESEDEQRVYVESVVIKPTDSNVAQEDSSPPLEDSIHPHEDTITPLQETNTTLDLIHEEQPFVNEESHIQEQIDALTQEPTNTIEESEEQNDIIQIHKTENLGLSRAASGHSKKVGRITFRNSDSKRLQLQLNLLKKQVDDLFGMLDLLRTSDNELNKDLKTMVASMDILGIFHHRFSKLPFRNNPFINRNYNKVHARIPKLRNAVDGLINTLESIAGGGGETSNNSVQNIKEEELPTEDRSTTRILIKSIRYADQIAN